MARHYAMWLVAGAAIAVALSYGVRSTPLIDPDEGRNAEVAREMASTNDFVVPHLNGIPYLDKPVAYFAATSLSIKLFGANELSVRLPSMLFAIATAILTIVLGVRIFEHRTASLAGLALMASPLVIAYARIVIFDSMMMFAVTGAMIAFYMAWETQRTGWLVAAWTLT